MIVTTGAGHGQSHPNCHGRVDPVDSVFQEELLQNQTSLGVVAIVPVETRRNDLIHGRVRQQVTGQLLDRKLIERHVGLVSFNDPVAPAPHCARSVVLIAIRIGIAGRFHPLPGHSFGVSIAVEQSVDQLLVGIRRLVREKRVHLLHRRRQSGEIERDPSNQGFLLRQGRRLKIAVLQSRENEMIHRVDGVVRIRHFR